MVGIDHLFARSLRVTRVSRTCTMLAACAIIAACTTTRDANARSPIANVAAAGQESDLEDSGSPITAGTIPPIRSVSGDSLSNFGVSSGTLVGKRAQELYGEVIRLRASVDGNESTLAALRANGADGAIQYHSAMAAITARLQNGTTRGNPILLRQRDEAEASLNLVTNSLEQLNTLQNAIYGDSSVAVFLSSAVQSAFDLTGAVDEDHDQLRLLRTEVARLATRLESMRTEVTADIGRQTDYLTTERKNLQTVSSAILRGEMVDGSARTQPIGLRTNANAGRVLDPMRAAPRIPVSNADDEQSYDDRVAQTEQSAPRDTGRSYGKLVAIVRYNQDNVAFEEPLAATVGTVRQTVPDPFFTVLAIAPTQGAPATLARARDDARRNAENVERALGRMGVEADKLAGSSGVSSDARYPEVHIYVRSGA